MKMMKKKKLNGWTMFDVVIVAIAIFSIIVTIYPMIYVVSCSFSQPREVLAGNVVFLPKGFTIEAYKIVFRKSDFWLAMLMTVVYVVLSCAIMIATTVTVAYPLTRPNLKFRTILNYYLIIPMYFGGGLIPGFIVMTKLGLYNTIWAVLLPGISIWNIILCRTYMASISRELTESAMLDGCSNLQLLLKIILPLSKPILAVILIYTIVGTWNSWFGASIYLTNEALHPVQLYMKVVLSSLEGVGLDANTLAQLPVEELLRYEEMARSANQIRYAMIVFTVLPIILVYPMFQKYFTKGIMLGSLKG